MPGIQAFVFFIAGFICFIPGAYHVVYIYWAVKGKRGYDFYHLPLFNWLSIRFPYCSVFLRLIMKTWCLFCDKVSIVFGNTVLNRAIWGGLIYIKNKANLSFSI